MPTQSLPVSPPPITTTFLSLALIVAACRVASPAHNLVLCRQVIHREDDIFITSSLHRQISRLACAHCQADTVELFVQVVSGYVFADGYVGLELHALGRQLVQPAVDYGFAEFEIGDAVSQNSADFLVFFKNHDVVSRPRKLLRRR